MRRFTEGKEVRKVVYVPNRLLNLVVWSLRGEAEAIQPLMNLQALGAPQ